MDGLDRTLQRIYERLGWRIIISCQALNFVYGYLLGAALGFGWARIAEISTQNLLLAYAVWAAVFATCTIVATIGVLRTARPLVSWIDDGRRPDRAEAAWRAALQLPASTVRWYALSTLVSTPVFVALLSVIEPEPLAAVLGGYGLGYAIGVTAITAGTAFTAQLAVRPLARDVASIIANHPSPPPGITVRMRLLGMAPVLLLMPLAWGATVMAEPGSEVLDLLPAMLVGIALVAVFAVPLVVLGAYSTLQPLDDVLRATERLKAGDLGTRVPVLSADEHGQLAHSFNQAIQGLARARAARRRERRPARRGTRVAHAHPDRLRCGAPAH